MDSKQKAKLIKKWFERGRNSVLRQNQSGCCCIIDDNDEVVSVCGAHQEWLERHLTRHSSRLKTAAAEFNEGAPSGGPEGNGMEIYQCVDCASRVPCVLSFEDGGSLPIGCPFEDGGAATWIDIGDRTEEMESYC